MKFMALIPNFYEFGKTVKEAKANLRRGGHDAKKCGIYECPDDYWIDDFGYGHGSADVKFVEGTDHRR